ncbi:MAG TPA: sugar-binding domain-containing protein [Tissierellales bacterium]|nr:sugar-binding domain-containing protein [Tissierellales bacterium]
MYVLIDIIELEKKIVPEILDIMEKRYDILRGINYNQPIGRRTLANNLNMGERTVRTEVNILKEQGLLSIEPMGMYVTQEGKNLLEDLTEVIHKVKGLSELERKMEKLLEVENVLIVPGNSDENDLILKDIGKTAALYLKKIIKDNYIIGITGGSTMAQVADEMPKIKSKDNVLVLPARGGLGKDVETQANSIAAKLAKKLDGNYRLLHAPDSIEKETLEVLLKLEDVKETLELIRKMDILVFGIGRADVMAERRKLSNESINCIMDKGAVSEAFGHYFDTEGKQVWESMTVGISLEDFKKTKHVIGVAGGEAKSDAILSVTAFRKNMTIVTDEGAALKILNNV